VFYSDIRMWDTGPARQCLSGRVKSDSNVKNSDCVASIMSAGICENVSSSEASSLMQLLLNHASRNFGRQAAYVCYYIRLSSSTRRTTWRLIYGVVQYVN
jgi:hypothetical protein